MGITADGWFDWMERDPGPAHKVNGGRNGGKGIIPHSAEGYRKTLRDILFGPRRASWHISVLTDKAIQHYPIWAQCWTSGSAYPNNNFLAGETEGCGSVAGIPFEPWTDFQTATWVRVGRELSQLQGWTARRPVNGADKTASCYEHNECVRFGSEYTSCPSGRNRWDILIPAINAPTGDDPMTPQEKAAFEALANAVKDIRIQLNEGMNATEQAMSLNKANPKHEHPWWTPKGIFYIGGKAWPF